VADRRVVIGILWLAAISLILSGWNIFAVNRASNARATADVEIRREGAITSAKTFYFVCKDYRSIQLQKVREGHQPSRISETLRVLHVQDDPEIRRVIERNYRADLRRYSLGACASLPAVLRTKRLYKVDVSKLGE
jgi:hypothetical protein